MNDFETKLEFPCHFRTDSHGRKRMRKGPPPAPKPAPPGRVPRIARFLALAMHYDSLIANGVVTDYADLARLSGVTRARISQIMDMLTLCPIVQEEILHLPLVAKGRDPINVKNIRIVVAARDWNEQRRRWAKLKADRLG